MRRVVTFLEPVPPDRAAGFTERPPIEHRLTVDVRWLSGRPAGVEALPAVEFDVEVRAPARGVLRRLTPAWLFDVDGVRYRILSRIPFGAGHRQWRIFGAGEVPA